MSYGKMSYGNQITKFVLGLSAAFLIGLGGGSLTGGEDHHDHPTEGPNGGALVELGDEEYHAEFIVKDKNKEVIFHLLDGSAKKAVAIGEPELLLNLKVAGKPQQYKIPAAPSKGDPEGKASRFVIKDEKLVRTLHAKGVSAQMRVKINTRSYSGKVSLAHDHDHDHDHDHGEKK